MHIYKITNILNNKIYIGQTSKTPQQRWKRHVQDANANRVNTHLASAIQKYGEDAFVVESICQTDNQDELNKLEQYYIHLYDSLKNGYNETDSINKCGGNTYAGRTQKQMEITKNKISESKKGKKNPNSRKIKSKNINTKEELFFDSLSECQAYFNEQNHNFITRRVQHKTKYAYQGYWLIAYQEDEYITDFTTSKSNRKAKPVKVTDNNTNETKKFNSYAAAERYFNEKPKTFSGSAYKCAKIFTVGKYTIEKLY